MLMVNQYAQYSTSDFDKFDCLKVSKFIYLILIFVLRGYVVWLMSVSNMRDKVGVIQWFYPEPSLFYLSLISGVGGIFTLILLSLRRPSAASWIKNSWRYIREIIVFSLVFDLLINLVGYFYWQLESIALLATNIFVIILACYVLYNNKRIKINITEFPEALPEK